MFKKYIKHRDFLNFSIEYKKIRGKTVRCWIGINEIIETEPIENIQNINLFNGNINSFNGKNKNKSLFNQLDQL
jgi:hypothetical protein